MNDFFKEHAKEFLPFWAYLSQRSITVTLSEEKWKRINEEFKNFHNDEIANEEDERVGLIFRHGLMLYKICMVLSAFRIYEERNEADTVISREEDFETAMQLVKLSLVLTIMQINL